MSPSDIEILIHYHCCPAAHQRADAPAVKQATSMFLIANIIEADDSFESGYKTTARGKALMEVLCSTQFPTEAWIDSNGKVIEII